MERTLENLRTVYPHASDDVLLRYIDLRDEGYSGFAARMMAGLADPATLQAMPASDHQS